MTIFNPTVTDDGQAAAFNAESTGTELVITDIAFGLGSYDPTGAETALVNEVERVPVASGSRLSPTQIRMNAVWDDDAANSPINEVGIYAGSVLFAVWSRASGGALGYKTPGVDFVFNYSMLLTVVPPGSVTVLEDTGTSAVLAALMSHVGEIDAHPQYMKRIRRIWTGEATGTADALILTPDVADVFTAFEEGQGFVFIAAANNTGAVTIEVDGVDTLPLKKQGSIALDPNDLIAGAVYEAVYDGTNLQLVSGNGGSGSGGQTFESEVFTATAGQDTFTVSYTPGNVMVCVNGRQLSTDEFTAADGAEIVLDTPATLGDAVLVIGFSSFSVANVVDLTNAQSVNGVKTFSSSPLVPTVAASDNTQKVASTAQVQAAITDREASTTAAGIAELATNAETQAGSSTTHVVTPAGLASVQATTSARGLIEIATNAEAQAMSDAVRAVTPANLAAVAASNAEALAGTSDQRFITPLKLRFGFAMSLGASDGYIKFPDWLGGWIWQYGTVASAASGSSNVITPFTFPIPFPNACRALSAIADLSVNDRLAYSGSITTTGSSFSVADVNGGTVQACTIKYHAFGN